MANRTLARGATELLWLAAGGVLVGASLPWESPHTGRVPATGFEVLWGPVTVGVALAIVALHYVHGWERTVLPTVAAGGGILLVALSWPGSLLGPIVTGFAGAAMLLSGLVGAAAVYGVLLPRPLAERTVLGGSLTRRALSRFAVGGVALVAAAMLLIGLPIDSFDVRGALLVGYGLAVAFVATGRAWSRPVAIAAILVGVALVRIVLDPELNSAGDGFPASAIALSSLLLLLLGGLALLVAGVLTLGGAGTPPWGGDATGSPSADPASSD